MNRPNAAALAVSGLAAGFSIGCGAGATSAGEGLQPFQLLIDWQVEPTYLGVYLARERGHFEPLGLDSRDRGVLGSQRRSCRRGRGQLPDRDRIRRGDRHRRQPGASLVSTAVLYQRLPTVIYGLVDQGVDAPADLTGKRVGV